MWNEFTNNNGKKNKAFEKKSKKLEEWKRNNLHDNQEVENKLRGMIRQVISSGSVNNFNRVRNSTKVIDMEWQSNTCHEILEQCNTKRIEI